MIIHTCEQRTPEWHALRIGRVTGTRFKDMVGGKPPTFELLCKKIAAERLTGQSSDQPFRITPAMERGVELEGEARAAFEIETLQRVSEVGFVEMDDMFGVSPDGLIGDNVGLELKCPLPSTHLGYLMAQGDSWRSYKWQVQGSLWVTGAVQWYFVSYCPAFAEDKRLLIEVVEPDMKYQALITEKAEKLRERVNEIIEAVK